MQQDSASQLIPASVYLRTRTLFEKFASRSSLCAFLNNILEESTLSVDLNENDIVVDQAVILRDVNTLAKSLGSRYIPKLYREKDLIILDHPIQDLWDFATGLSLPEFLALDVLLRRGLNAFEALITYPLETWLNSQELSTVMSMNRSVEPVNSNQLRWTQGSNIDYGGYTCVIVKFTRLCNLRCVYCRDWRVGAGNTMPFNVQANLFHKLLNADEHTMVDIVWHGGETTLIGKNAFYKILALQRWFARPGQKIRNRVQTNATTLNESWIHLLKRFNFRVGVSIDGPAEIHNVTRPNVVGKPTFEIVQRGLRLLKEANLLEHVYLVLTESLISLGAEPILDFLKDESINQVGLLPANPGNGPAQPLNPEMSYLTRTQYIQFLIQIYHARQSSPSPWIRIREIDAVLNAIRGQMPGFCEMLGSCVGTYFSIEPDGQVGHCDKYVGDSNYTLGSILEQTFTEIRNTTKTRGLALANDKAAEKHSSCRFYEYCRGWCPHERYIANRYDITTSESCCGLSALFSALLEDNTHEQDTY